MTIYLATIRGTIATNDIWQCGFHVQSDSDAPGVATLVASKVPSLFNAIWTASVVPKSVRIAQINEATGATEETSEALVTAPTPVAGSQLPAEVAVCVTLRPVSGLITGRFYLPSIPSNLIDTNGNLTSAHQTTLRDRLQTFFQTDLGGAASPSRVGIYSRKNHQFVGASKVEVGSVLDSQRRRRNKLVETRLSGSVL